MAAVIFETQKCAESLVEVGVPRIQANRHAELMAESFVHYADKLVTRDYLDARLDGQWEKINSRFVQMQSRFDGNFAQMQSNIDMRFAAVDGKFSQLFWMVGIGFTVLIIPQLQAWFS